MIANWIKQVVSWNKEALKTDNIGKDDTENDVYEADAQDLVLLANNEKDLYNSMLMPMYENLTRKKFRGVCDSALAPKMFMYVIDVVAKRWYDRMVQWADDGRSTVIKPTKEVKLQAAEELAREFEESFNNREYEFMTHMEEKYKKLNPKKEDGVKDNVEGLEKESARPPKPTDQLGPDEEYVFDAVTNTWIKQIKKVSRTKETQTTKINPKSSPAFGPSYVNNEGMKKLHEKMKGMGVEWDGKGDERLFLEDQIGVSALLMTKKEYDAWQKDVATKAISGVGYGVSGICGSSGYEYWAREGEFNYVMIVARIDQEKIDSINVDKLLDDMNELYDYFSKYDNIDKYMKLKTEGKLPEVPGTNKEAADTAEDVETTEAPESSERKLPVSEVDKVVPPSQIDTLKQRSLMVSKDIVETAKESKQLLKDLYTKVIKLQADLAKAKQDAKEASEKVLAKTKAPEMQLEIIALTKQISENLNEGEGTVVSVGNSILAKIEDEDEKINYKYYVETEKENLEHIKQQEAEKKQKIESYGKELDKHIDEYKRNVAKGIEKIITTKERLVTFPKLSTIVKQSSILSVLKDIIDGISGWLSGLNSFKTKIDSL